MPLPNIPPDYAKNMMIIWEMTIKSIFPHTTIKIILKSRYPLPCAKPESSGDDKIESDSSLEVLADGQEEDLSPSLLPCAEP